MRYVNKILYLAFSELVEAGISAVTIKMAKQRKSKSWNFIDDPLDKRCVLIQYDTLDVKYKNMLFAAYGDVYQYAINEPILTLINYDVIGEQFYLDYTVDGKQLTAEQVERYTWACSWLNMLKTAKNDKLFIKNLGVKVSDFYVSVISLIQVKKIALPTSHRRLMDKLTAYEKNGYEVLISEKIGNKNRAKLMDKLSTSMLLEMLAHPNQYDDVYIMVQYNAWALANGYEAISKSTVKNYRKKYDKEIVMQREGNASLNAKYIKQVKGVRPAWPMLLVESDDNHLDLYFYDIKTKNPYVRYKGIFVVDSYNDYVLGYAVSTVLDAELVRMAYADAMRHIRSITGGYYVPAEVKTDKWAIKELKPFYESFARHMDTPVGSKHRGYIEQFFGTAHWKRCLKAGANNYTGNNITAKNRGVNLEYTVSNKNSYPTVGNEALTQIATFVQRLRYESVDGASESKHDVWMKAWNMMPDALKVCLTDEQYLLKFGSKHSKPITITNRGVEFTIHNKRYSYDVCVDELSDVIGLSVELYYDQKDMQHIVAVSGNVRVMCTPAQYHTRTMAESSEGSREALNAVFMQKKRTVELLADKAEERKNVLKAAQMSAEDALMNLSTPKEVKQIATETVLLQQAGVYRGDVMSDEDFYNSLIDEM